MSDNFSMHCDQWAGFVLRPVDLAQRIRACRVRGRTGIETLTYPSTADVVVVVDVINAEK